VGPKWDPTVTFGNILTILTLVVSALVFVVKMDDRISVLERAMLDHDQRIRAFEHAKSAP
jgi:hypothetical protein